MKPPLTPTELATIPTPAEMRARLADRQRKEIAVALRLSIIKGIREEAPFRESVHVQVLKDWLCRGREPLPELVETMAEFTKVGYAVELVWNRGDYEENCFVTVSWKETPR